MELLTSAEYPYIYFSLPSFVGVSLFELHIPRRLDRNIWKHADTSAKSDWVVLSDTQIIAYNRQTI